MNYLKVGEVAKRNDNGGIVRVLEVRPNGLRVFYRCEDADDGHTVLIEHTDLRPLDTPRG